MGYPDPPKSREGRTEGGKFSGNVKAGLYGSKPGLLARSKEVTYLDSNGVSDVGVSKEELQHSGNVKAGLENPKYFDEESSETLTCRAASQD